MLNFVFYLRFLIFFVRFYAFLRFVLCANLSGSKLCICYFVSFFNVWLLYVLGRNGGKLGSCLPLTSALRFSYSNVFIPVWHYWVNKMREILYITDFLSMNQGTQLGSMMVHNLLLLHDRTLNITNNMFSSFPFQHRTFLLGHMTYTWLYMFKYFINEHDA